MAFNFVAFVTSWLLNKGVAVQGASEELARIREQYPDSADRIDAFQAWLTEKLAPTHDVAGMVNTLRGIAIDMVNGTSGVDPDASMGSL